jgi:hypothetical protein
MSTTVWDEYVKIALDKGLIKEAEAEHTERNTKSPRWDSKDISAIEALYGVKPDAPKAMDYQHNIMEVAHPNSMVIAPSYDKLNGLVENEMERQNILMHIVYKEPEMGSPNQGRYPLAPAMLFPNTMGNVPKYAQKDLLMSLVRVANDMDNKDKEELRVLADACLTQLHSLGITKQVILPLAGMVPWLAAAAAILGVIYVHEHLAASDQGIKENYTRLQSQLQDFLDASETLGFGHQYDAFLKQEVAQVQAQLQEFWSAYSEAMPLLLAMEKPSNSQDLAQQSQKPQAQDFVHAFQVITDEASKVFDMLNKIEQQFNNPDFKAEHTQEKGAITSLLDKIPFLHGGKGSLTADDFDDVVNAIPPFMDSVKRLRDTLAKASQHKDAILEQASAIHSQTQSELGANSPAAPASAAPAQKSVKDIDNEASGIEKGLTGLMDIIPGFGG